MVDYRRAGVADTSKIHRLRRFVSISLSPVFVAIVMLFFAG